MPYRSACINVSACLHVCVCAPACVGCVFVFVYVCVCGFGCVCACMPSGASCHLHHLKGDPEITA